MIVGAGVAGLAAARRLHEHGIHTIVLEARHRIGGRAYTVHDDRSALPIELGAEFLHGDAPEVREIADAARLVIAEIDGDRWRAAHGRLTRADDFWERIERVLSRASTERTPDRPLSALFAEGRAGRRASEDRMVAREFVQGFHAAELDRISERAIADGGNPGKESSERRIARLVHGYGGVVNWLGEPVSSHVHLRHVVSSIEWTRGHVVARVRGRGSRARAVAAKAAIVTVPISLLHPAARGRGAIDLVPDVPSVREAASLVAMGQVQRVVILLDRPVVELLGERRTKELQRAAFFLVRGVDVPVWWTTYPMHTGIMIGWAGGPAATALNQAPDEIVPRAVNALADGLGLDRRRLDRHLVATFVHDWSRDPFSRGAYGYALVGGADAAKKLARPVQGTLFFAGEAAEAEGRNATVHGAIDSGRRAATQAMRSLARG